MRTAEERKLIMNEIDAKRATGLTTDQACAEHGVTKTAYYSWRVDQKKRANREAGITVIPVTKKKPEPSHTKFPLPEVDASGEVSINGSPAALAAFFKTIGSN